MAPMRALRRALGIVCLLACGSALVAGCGGGSGSTTQVNPEAEAGKSRPAPPKSAFPAPEGRTLRTFVKQVAEVHPEVKVSPAGEVFYPGHNRYAFLVAEKGIGGQPGKEVTDAEVAIYFSKVPAPGSGAKAKSGKGGKGRPANGAAFRQLAIGPFPARIESLATKPGFQGKTTTEAADVASVVYSAELDFPGAGEYRPVVVIKEKGGIAEKSLKSIHVGEFAKIPRPGERAPLIQTPTADSVDGNLAKLSTRVPPDTQNKVNYAEVLGKEPILLLFTTPKFCQSRVCGPVVDVAQQAQHEFEGKANFIHMEIYNDNDPSKGVRPQVRRFHLPTEPWLFAINREGVVSAAIEGAFGTQLMDKTVEKVIAE
ncbi:MAG TPA: hypothetical protein VHZ54_12115 [Solirubrobacterales bacterium]|jgi:hypothetical protein|nr:hypothetical protein [Solirubrobacterales bacterium]